ncbi:MAG: hypothetical protein PVG84_11415 [Desulfobacterales bacterium]
MKILRVIDWFFDPTDPPLSSPSSPGSSGAVKNVHAATGRGGEQRI